MGLSWKLLAGPAVLLSMKAAKIDYDVPHNLLIIRNLYAVSQLVVFAAMGVIYLRISKEGDAEHSVKVKVQYLTGPTEERKMTYKEYDMSELQKLVNRFGMGALMTIGIHVYMAWVIPFLLQMVSQPITLYDHALFSLYILRKDGGKDDKLKRPFPSDSPMASAHLRGNHHGVSLKKRRDAWFKGGEGDGRRRGLVVRCKESNEEDMPVEPRIH